MHHCFLCSDSYLYSSLFTVLTGFSHSGQILNELDFPSGPSLILSLPPIIATITTDKSSSSLVVSGLPFSGRANASAAWFLIKDLCTTSNSSSDRPSRQCANRRSSSLRFESIATLCDLFEARIYDPSSTCIVTPHPKLQPKATDVLYHRFFRGLQSRWPIAEWLFHRLRLFLHDETTNFLSYASVSRDKCLLLCSKACTGANTNFSCSVPNVSCFSCVRVSNVLGSLFLSYLCSSAARRTDFGTTSRCTLQK